MEMTRVALCSGFPANMRALLDQTDQTRQGARYGVAGKYEFSPSLAERCSCEGQSATQQ